MNNKKLSLFACATILSCGTLMAQDWKISGNALTETGKFGSTSNQSVEFMSNNIVNGVLTKNGRWGFGTSLPSAKFQINSAEGENAFRVQVGGNTKLVLASNGGLTVGANILTPPVVGLFVSGSTGIGISSPKSKLHVQTGTSGASPISNTSLTLENSSNNYATLLTPNANESGILFGNPSNVASGGIIYNSSFNINTPNGLQFRTNGNIPRMVLTNDGKLGIGGAPGVYITKINQNGKNGLNIANTTTDISDWEIFTSNNLFLFGNGFFKGSFSQADGTYSSVSDGRLKKNIQPMPSVLQKITQLKPSTYQFKNVTDKQENIGFIAQEVMNIFPDLVTHNVNAERDIDVYTLNYSGFGAIAVKGIQELIKISEEKEVKIETQQKQIDNLQKQIDELRALTLKSNQNTTAFTINNKPLPVTLKSALLEQNTPNPFSNSTTIQYSLPEKFNTARIIITDKAGRTMKQVNVSGTGKGMVNVNAFSLVPGAYRYALIVDGKLISEKQMVLAK